MKEPADALEAGLQLASELESRGVPYALGGALAYGQYGIPRATNDVDVNVFVEPSALAPVFASLRALGIELDERSSTRSRSRGSSGWHDGGFGCPSSCCSRQW